MAGPLQTTAASAAAEPDAQARRWWVRLGVGVAAVAVLAAGIAVWAGRDGPGSDTLQTGTTAAAVREPLVVTITESGEVDAKQSIVVRNEVEGQSTIVWIIEEGMLVKEGDVLVRLDSADLEEKLRSQEMQAKTSKAAFEKADKAYLISESNRESLLAQASLDVKFALLDLRKYLGADLADVVVGENGHTIFDALVGNSRLGGEGLQQKRILESDIKLAEEELSRAQSQVEWTRKLEGLGYVTGSELEADELALQRKDVALEQARTALALFRTYEFPKMAEKYYTDWLEAGRERDRVDARSQSELASAKADLDNKREALRLEETRLDNVREQLAATTIKAPQGGMVVYDTGRGHRWGGSEALEAGSTIHHQQALVKLPDLSEMNVAVRLHESVVKQVSAGDTAYVRVDALPDRRLTGTVSKIAVMPDRQNWFMNPGLKTYTSEVTLEETPEGLKPGMNAQVEVLIDRRDDVLQVPISAVHVEKGFQVIYVDGPKGIETRRIEVGLSNQQRVEVTRGVTEGERVYLYRPTGAPAIEVPEDATPPDTAPPGGETPGGGRRGRRPGGPDGASGGPPARSPRADAADDQPQRPQGGPGGAAFDMKNLTPEQRKQLQERLQKLPADQRERILKAMQQHTSGSTPTDKAPAGRGRRPQPGNAAGQGAESTP